MQPGDTLILEMLEEVTLDLPNDRHLVYEVLHSPGFVGDPRKVLMDEHVLRALVAGREGPLPILPKYGDYYITLRETDSKSLRAAVGRVCEIDEELSRLTRNPWRVHDDALQTQIARLRYERRDLIGKLGWTVVDGLQGVPAT